MKVVLLLIVLVLVCVAGCSVAKRPVIDRSSPEYREVVMRLYTNWRIAEDEKYYGLEDEAR